MNCLSGIKILSFKSLVFLISVFSPSQNLKSEVVVVEEVVVPDGGCLFTAPCGNQANVKYDYVHGQLLI